MSENTDLNSLFNRYWKDYQEGNTIADGLAYENQLRQYCDLNGSLDSLKELDGFLTAIRRDMLEKISKANLKLDNKGIEEKLLQKKEFHNLLLFIGFYTGDVLAKQHKAQARFLTQSELQNLDKTFTSDNFIYSMAVFFTKDDTANFSEQVSKIKEPWLFFVYEPIIMRLCGGYDYQLTSIQGQQKIADSLYQSVLDRLPPEVASKQTNQQDLKTKIKKATSTKIRTTTKQEQKPPIHKTTDIYSSLLAELDTIPVKQTQGVEIYEKAKVVMAKLDDFAKQQGKRPSELQLSDNHKKVCQQALNIIKRSAEVGNTTAMLHLAVYYMRGDWLKQDIAQGVELIKQSANAQDKRAMNTLSKMYYQGVEGVLASDSEQGKHWLEIASKGGHPDARKIHYEMRKTEMMISERNKEVETDKKYLYLFSVLALFVLLILIFL